MIRSTIVAAAATLALVAPTVTADAQAAPRTDDRSGTSITGKWKGAVYGDNGGPAGYAAKVDIVRKNGTYKGHVVYPNTCSGKWVYQGKANGWFRFREVITNDPGAPSCVTPVAVKTKRKGAKLRVVWTEPSTGDQGHMLAHRR